MEIFSVGVLVIIASVTLYGVYKLLSSITFKRQENRYEYEIVDDGYGNKIEKVIDKTDKGDREWNWQSLS